MRVLVVGAGPQGHVVLDILRDQGCHEVVGFIDDDPNLWGSSVAGLQVLGGMESIPGLDLKGLGAVVAIGNSAVRIALGERLQQLGVALVNAIHPSAVIMDSATLGVGNVVCPGAIICTRVRIGNHVILNTAAIADHETVLQDGCHLSNGVAVGACVTIERGALVGVGATISNSVTIGEWAVVGSGAVVLRDVPARTIAWGVPARVMKEVDETFDWKAVLGGRRK